MATLLGRCPGCGLSVHELVGGGWRSSASRGRGLQTAVVPRRPEPQWARGPLTWKLGAS